MCVFFSFFIISIKYNQHTPQNLTDRSDSLYLYRIIDELIDQAYDTWRTKRERDKCIHTYIHMLMIILENIQYVKEHWGVNCTLLAVFFFSSRSFSPLSLQLFLLYRHPFVDISKANERQGNIFHWVCIFEINCWSIYSDFHI